MTGFSGVIKCLTVIIPHGGEKVSRKNKLNDLTNSEWLRETKSFWHGGGGDRSDDGRVWTQQRRQELAQWLRENYGDEDATAMMEQVIPSAMYSVAPPRDKRKMEHPATFSERDIERLIRLFTKDGQTVLDPFVGTGSTLLACAETGRRGIGIELVDRWVDVCRERVGEVENLFLDLQIIHGDAESELEKLDSGCVDFVVTSPPYWSILNKDAGMKVQAERLDNDLETTYSDREDDLGNVPDYDTFLDRLEEIFSGCARVLAEGQYLACIVSDFRDGPDFYMYHADMAETIERAGLPLKGITILLQDSKNLYPFAIPYAFVSNIHHQYILIHQKPATK